jgi:MoxR-like ATPase
MGDSACEPAIMPGSAEVVKEPPGAAEAEKARLLAERLVEAVGGVLLGKEGTVRDCVVALFGQGHVLVEDFPGVGKTLLAKALARCVDCAFSRVQFTPDLLPSDVTGVNIFNQRNGEFEFRPGPIFANVVLADEINRASPKTQSSLLECMQERQATIDNVTYPIAAPFMVIATQNPIEYEGTYSLPEAQLDRFMMRVSLGYPDTREETRLLLEESGEEALSRLVPVADRREVLEVAGWARRVVAAEPVRRYIVDILQATRDDNDIYLGASPRAGLSLLRAAKVSALIRGRTYVVPQDVKDRAVRVLAHRLILSPEARLHGNSAESVLKVILNTVPAPSG